MSLLTLSTRLLCEISGRIRARPSLMMSGAAPGRCANCGSDAYIQLAVEDAMLCAHCYAERLGLTKLVAARVAARKAGDHAMPKAPAVRPRPV